MAPSSGWTRGRPLDSGAARCRLNSRILNSPFPQGIRPQLHSRRRTWSAAAPSGILKGSLGGSSTRSGCVGRSPQRSAEARDPAIGSCRVLSGANELSINHDVVAGSGFGNDTVVVALVDVLGYESPWVYGLLKWLVFGLVYVPIMPKACWPGVRRGVAVAGATAPVAVAPDGVFGRCVPVGVVAGRGAGVSVPARRPAGPPRATDRAAGGPDPTD